ncbi:hypothetical protein QBC42DRAFT_349761 [Cladorrhinum samala]|uniref:DNA mismatch repair protein HSM3 N-terminal domain-containing protein n=1 Tax=Cladorrhinum samala TaxID=585594 RepID=A0AAV9HB05_9PEZI|nr:hypothetical protein QBC42DRAFT_349761 [Cladorrhinum samala]
MDTTPISGLPELDKHLDELLGDVSLTLSPKLFDDVELQLTESNIPSLIPLLLPKLVTLLQQYPLDPTPIVTLTIKLLKPISFTQILQLASESSLIAALSSPSPQVNILALTILHKAAASPSDAAILSVMPSLFSTFLTTWLATPHVEVGQKALKVLGDLLDIDCPLPPPPPPPRQPAITTGIAVAYSELVLRKSPGKGALWNLLLSTHSTYALLLDLVSGRHPLTAASQHQLSLAQGRLLRLLPRLACLNLAAISQSQFPAPTPARFTNGHGSSSAVEDADVSAPVPTPTPGQGILQFAALHMVDKSDALMHLSLVDFFEAFVSLMRVAEHSAFKVEVTKSLLEEALKDGRDEVLKGALVTLPDRTVEEEADGLRRWLEAVMLGAGGEVPIR